MLSMSALQLTVARGVPLVVAPAASRARTPDLSSMASTAVYLVAMAPAALPMGATKAATVTSQAKAQDSALKTCALDELSRQTAYSIALVGAPTVEHLPLLNTRNVSSREPVWYHPHILSVTAGYPLA